MRALSSGLYELGPTGATTGPSPSAAAQWRAGRQGRRPPSPSGSFLLRPSSWDSAHLGFGNAGDDKPRSVFHILVGWCRPERGAGRSPKPPSIVVPWGAAGPHGRNHTPRHATPLIVSPSSHGGIKVRYSDIAVMPKP